ncbi:MAG: RNA methyltransferase, partial [Solobacterium sp.]|nr:RNA methyltransferase [Solobacterium sp.]
YIPYANDFRNALNAASAAAVLSFEVYRHRR